MQTGTDKLSKPTGHPVRAVILDWAGTAVDYGCRGPAAVFIDVFSQFGVEVTMAEARRYMGLMKRDHIRAMCKLPTVSVRWETVHGRPPDESDIDALYRETEPRMVAAVTRHADPIPGAVEFLAAMRERGIPVGSTTGYTGPMVTALAREARSQGYAPDAIVCSSEVPAGRPRPWMCFLNAIRLDAYPLWRMVKIGDTVADIEEGLNAGMWTIGVTRTSNGLGLTESQADALPPEDLDRRLAEIGAEFEEAGAHYLADGIWACEPLIETIGDRIERGERPV